MDGFNGLSAAHIEYRAPPRLRLEPRPAADVSRPRSAAPAPTDQMEDSPKHSTITADSLSYQRSERTTLVIRTQEGDVVRLMFRSRESGNMDSTHAEDGQTVVNALELRASARTDLSVLVRGDLNPDELAAIRSTIEQAGALAEEFFAGDLDAAFESASAMDIDAGQLSRVALRMKSSERLTYSSFRATSPAPRLAAAHPSLPSVESKASTPEVAPAEPPVGVSETRAPDTLVEAPAAQPEATVSPPDRTLTLRRIGDFLQRSMATFDEDRAPSGGTEPRRVLSASIDLSLKLLIFRATLVASSEASADGQARQLAALVPATLDALAAQQTSWMAVA